MKGFINVIKENIIDNTSAVPEEIMKHIIWWVALKWFMAIDLQLIIIPLFGMTYSPKISKMCYWIEGMLGAIIVTSIIGLIISYLIDICLRHKRECTDK